MENQPSQVSPNVATTSPSVPAADWPLVPPAPAPVIPAAGGVEAPTIRTLTTRPAGADEGEGPEPRLRPRSVTYEVDDSPTMSLTTPGGSGEVPAATRPRRLIPGALPRLGGADTRRRVLPRPLPGGGSVGSPRPTSSGSRASRTPRRSSSRRH